MMSLRRMHRGLFVRASADRRAALDRMIEIADAADMYDLTATPKRTR